MIHSIDRSCRLFESPRSNLNLGMGLCLASFLLSTLSVAQDNSSQTDDKAVQRWLQQAEAATQDKDYGQAVAAMTKVVELMPEDMDLRYQLAMCLLRADRMPEMWQVLRAAATKDPQHPKIGQALVSYWKMFDEQGLFNTDETIDQVQRVLGKPDQVAKGPNRDRYVYGFLAIEVLRDSRQVHQTIDLRGLTGAHFNPTEIVTVDLDGRGREVGHRTMNRQSTLAEFMLPGEKVQNWSELCSVQRLHGAARLPLRQFVENMMASLLQQAPQRQYRILEQSDDSILFEWKIPGGEAVDSDTHPAQHELVRLMRAEIDVHRIAFVVKQADMDEQLRSRWLKILQAATLQAVGETPSDETTSDEPSIAGASKAAMSKEKTGRSDLMLDQAVWQLGRTLSVAVFAHAQREEELAKQNLVRAFRMAQQLSVQLPRPFELVEDPMTNMTRAIGYLVEDMPQALQQHVNAAHLGTYQLAVRTQTLSLLASNRRLVEKSLPMIRQSVQQSPLPNQLIAALEERVRLDGTPEQIRQIIQKLHADVAMYYQTRRSRAAETNGNSSRAAMANSSASDQPGRTGANRVVLHWRGSQIGEVTADGEVWIAGEKVGDVTRSGEIWVAGEKEGDITAEGEIWKAGNKVGEVTESGEVWRDGERIASIEANGEIWFEGDLVGQLEGTQPRVAAAVLLFDFFDLGD